MKRARRLVAPRGTGALLSCALSPHDGGASLAVGGEHATALVFDLRGASLVAHRFTAAVGCFASEDSVPCVSYNHAKAHLLYCASGKTVSAWDLRKVPISESLGPASRVVRDGCGSRIGESPSGDAFDALEAADATSRSRRGIESSERHAGPVRVYAHNSDEINHFVIDSKGAFLCAADDNNEISVVDIGDRNREETPKTLRGGAAGHENIVSVLALRGHKPREIVSGGLDCRVCKWDTGRTSAVRRWSITELASAETARETSRRMEASANEDADEDAGPSPMMNPPFVHCVGTWDDHCDGALEDASVRRFVAAACGDGTVALVDLDAAGSGSASSAPRWKKKRKEKISAVSSSGGVAFLGRGGRGTPHASATSHVAFPGWGRGSVVVSGGNDRAIKLWRWRRFLFQGDGDGDETNERDVVELAHGRKVHWIAHASTTQACPGGGHVFVADTSEKISVYDVARA
jgi:WD40 repeat protein